MEKSFRRLLSFAVALLMVLSLVPFNGMEVYAAQTAEGETVTYLEPATPSYAAMIGSQGYETLQAAINAVKNGETITLQADCTENVAVTQAEGVNFTIDGNNKTFTGSITVNGKSAAYATAGLTVQNVKFTAASGAVCINLGVSGNNNTRYTSNVTVQNCTFTGTDNTAAAIKSYTGGDKNLTITGCTATGMHSLVQLKNVAGVTVSGCEVTGKNGISLGASSNVEISNCKMDLTGYGIRADAIETGAGATVTDCEIEAFIPVVVRNATEDYSLTVSGENTMTANNTDGLWCAIGIEEYGDVDKADLTAATGKVTVTVNDTGLNAAGVYGNYVEKPTGTLGKCYIEETDERARVYGEILGMTNATQSVVIKLYSGETLLATTTLAKSEYLNNDPLGVNIVISGKTSSSWNTVWEEGQPAKDLCPDKAVLYIDGNEMNTAVVTLGTIDDLGTPYVWEELEIFKVPVAQTMDAEGNVIGSYFTFEEALAAACADANVTRLEILADSEQTTVTNTEEYYDINQALTIGAPTGKSYTVTIAPGGAAMAVRVQDGGSLTIAENVTINHLDVVANGFGTTGENMTIDGTLYALSLKQWTNNGTITVSETGKVVLGNGDGQLDLAYGNGTVTINGTGDKTVDQFKAGYSGTRGNGNTLNLNNTCFEGGAWFNINGSNGTFNVNNSVLKVSGGDFNGDLKVTSAGNKINLTNGSELKVGALALGEGNQLKLDTTSKVTAKAITGAGTLVIDATGMKAGDTYESISADLSGYTGAIQVENNNLNAEIVDGKIVLKAAPVASVDGEEYADLISALKAVKENSVVEILSDVTVDEKWDARYTGAKITVPVTINGNNHTIKFTNTVYDGGNHMAAFRFEAAATVNNLTIDMSEALSGWGTRLRAISAKSDLTVDGCTFIGNGAANTTRAIIFGEGAGTNIGNVAVSVTNSTFKDWGRGISDNENGQDAKALTITGNTFTAASVNVSAAESITFNGNVMNDSWAKLVTYKSETLAVTAHGNTLTANGTTSATKNYIYAKIADAQEGFIVERLPYKVSTKAELQKALAEAQEGDEIILTADIDYGTDQLKIEKPIVLDLGDKTLTTRNAYGGMSVKGNPTIKNGTIVHASNTAAIKAWNAAAFEDLVIDVQGKGDANKTIGGIVLQSGATTRVGSIKNVTIKGDALTNGIETYNCGDATENVIGSMENVTIDAKGTGMLISAPCGTATNCSISGDVNGIEIWIKGTYSAKLDLANSAVEGGVFAHDEFSSNPAIVNNGTLSLTVDNATTGASEEDITLTIARAEKVEGILKDVMDNAEAKVNDTYYATLQAAVNVAVEGDTVTVLTDIELTEGITVAADKQITLDLNGKTVSMETADDAKYCLIYNNGDLAITDSGENGKLSYLYTGTNSGDAYNTIESAPGSVLTVQDGTIENLSPNCLIAYAIDGLTNGSAADVTVNIEGGKITSKKIAVRIFANSTTKTGTLNISGGEISGRVIIQNANANANKAVLNITGGTFNSNGYKTDVLYVGGSNGTTGDIAANVSGGAFNGEILSSINKGFITGGTFGTDVTEFCAPGYKAEANGDGTYGIQVTLPEVAITDIKGTLTGEDPDLTFALNFAIPNVEDLSEEYLNELFEAYGNYYVDYVLTINGLNGDTVTFNANGNADGYLAGQYDAWGENWVSVPFEDVVVEDGKGLYIMEYAAKLMGKTGLRFTLAEVATIVQNFDCGVYFTPEFLAEHPDLEVSLVLKVFTEDAEGTKIENIDVATNQFKNSYAAAVSGEGKQTLYYATFAEAYAAAQNGDTVELLKDVKLTGKLTVAKSITIDGNGFSIIADETAVWYTTGSKPLYLKQYKTHLLGINADGITLKDVVLDCNNNAAGINVYCAQNVVFDNVQIINATKGMAGLTVNGSTLTAKNALTISGNAIAVDISNGSGVTSALGVTIEDGTVTDLGNKTVKFASAANNNMTGAVDASGNAYFAAMDNAYYYTQAQIDSRTTGYTNGLTLLEDVTLSKDVTISGTLDLNGHDLTVADGKALKVEKNLTVTGEGSIDGAVKLTKETATLTASVGMNVTSGVEGYEVVYKNGVYSLAEIVCVAQIGTTKYETLAEALTAAQDGETVQLLWAEGDAPIAMDGAVYGKSVTITGTATVDWNKGFLFIGRGGEGNGTVTFENANLTSASNSASYGIHVSGREKNTTNKYDGTLIIKNSTIELDYLINKGTMTLDNSTLTVKNGFSIGGRPANETESGEDATATLNLTNGSKVIVNNHNGMGLGYEAIGVMNIDATSAFECTQKFLVTAKGTMNIAGTAKVAGLLTNNGTINLTAVDATLTTAESPVVTTTVEDYKVVYADGAYKLILKQVAQNTTTGKIYPTLQAAIDEATAGETIQVLEDIELTEGITVAADKIVTLDLNSKTVRQSKACTDSYSMIVNNGNLTITGNGKISFTDTGAGDPNATWGAYTLTNNGTLVVENGTIENLSAQNVTGQSFAHTSFAIFQYSGSTTINGGTISTPNYRSVRLWKGEMTINDGEFDGQVWVQAVDNSAKLTINGGSFSPNWNDGSSVFLENKTYTIDAEITGGKFAGKIGTSNAAAMGGFITGGIFTANAKENTNEDLLALARQFAENTDASTKEQYPYGVEVNEKIVAWNMQTGTEYETVSAALMAAKSGETVQMLKASNEENAVLTILNGITLDLNGKTLTAYYVMTATVNSYLVDSANGEGLLKVAKDNLILADNNQQLKIWKSEELGYRFASATFKTMLENNGSGTATFRFYLKETMGAVMKELADGATDGDGLTLRVKMTYSNSQGGQISLYFDYPVDVIEDYASKEISGTASHLYMIVRGLEKVQNVSFQAVLASGNVVFESVAEALA